MAQHNDVGKVGEQVASDFLESKCFQIIERNFWKPYGEIDIISREKSGKYRFIEVKTVSDVPHGTYRPEENMHPQKVRRLMRVIEVYLISHGTITDWQFDLICVFLNRAGKTARVRHVENIILGS
jgi:putative endonuclease